MTAASGKGRVARRKTTSPVAGLNPEMVARVLRLLDHEEHDKQVVLDDPASLVDVVWPLLGGRETEALVVAAVDRRRRVIDVEVLTTGSSAFTVVDPAQVYRWALTRKRAPHGIFLAHNHPSGDPTPSAQDREVTLRVMRIGAAIGIPLIDHIVTTDERKRWASLAAEGLIVR